MDDGRCTASAVGDEARAYDRRPAGQTHRSQIDEAQLQQKHEAARLGRDGSENTAESPLASIHRRIQEHTKRLNFAAEQLRLHTNRIHGSEPEPDRPERATETLLRGSPPMLPAIWEALQEMDATFHALAHQAERATTLA